VTLQDALQLIERGGVLMAALFAIWALVTGKVVTRREYDNREAQYLKELGKVETRLVKMERLNEDANLELMKQSSTNARLVEMTLLQRQEAEQVRKDKER
jgi:hypothetical protein